MSEGQLINVTGWVAGIIPALGAMAMIHRNRGEPWRISNFLCACILIALAALMVGLLTDALQTLERLNAAGKLQGSVFTQLRTSGVIWLVLFPAVVTGVAVNVLSQYLLSAKPQQGAAGDERNAHS